MINKEDLYTLRPYTPNDRNFIFATWLRGLYYGDSWFKEIPKNIFMANYHDALDKFMTKPGVVITIACLKDEPEVILGYSVSRQLQVQGTEIGVVDWIFVKSAWRNIGIGTLLLPKQFNAFTHMTGCAKSIVKDKYNKVVFNPFIFNWLLKGATHPMAKNKLPKDIKVDLPPQAPERTLQQIQNEYGSLAAKAGQNAYQRYILSKEAELFNQQMQNLNMEASALQAKQGESKNG